MSSLLGAACVVTGSQVLRPGWVEVADGRILQVGGGEPPRPVDVDLGAATVVPGFVDMHVHGGGGHNVDEATRDATRSVAELHRRHGTTSMIASLVSAAPTDLRHQVEALAEHVDGGLVAGIHLEGPWISADRCGAHDPTTLRDPDAVELRDLISAGHGTIRMITLAPERTGGIAAVEQIAAAGVVPALGHTEATYQQTRDAIAAGARVATHLFNAMRPLHHREPGPALALLEDDRVTLELIADGHHLHPALHGEVVTRAGTGRIALVTDAMAAAGMPDGSYRLGPLAVEVRDGGARVAGTSTIAGSTVTMDALFAAADGRCEGGRDDALLEAVAQTSLVPSRALGLGDTGIQEGASADLVVLDADLAVLQVMQRGRWFDASARQSP